MPHQRTERERERDRGCFWGVVAAYSGETTPRDEKGATKTVALPNQQTRGRRAPLGAASPLGGLSVQEREREREEVIRRTLGHHAPLGAAFLSGGAMRAGEREREREREREEVMLDPEGPSTRNDTNANESTGRPPHQPPRPAAPQNSPALGGGHRMSPRQRITASTTTWETIHRDARHPVQTSQIEHHRRGMRAYPAGAQPTTMTSRRREMRGPCETPSASSRQIPPRARGKGRGKGKTGKTTTTTATTTPTRATYGGSCERPSTPKKNTQQERPPIPRKRKLGKTGGTSGNRENLGAQVARLAAKGTAKGGYNDSFDY